MKPALKTFFVRVFRISLFVVPVLGLFTLFWFMRFQKISDEKYVIDGVVYKYAERNGKKFLLTEEDYNKFYSINEKTNDSDKYAFSDDYSEEKELINKLSQPFYDGYINGVSDNNINYKYSEDKLGSDNLKITDDTIFICSNSMSALIDGTEVKTSSLGLSFDNADLEYIKNLISQTSYYSKDQYLNYINSHVPIEVRVFVNEETKAVNVAILFLRDCKDFYEDL